MSNRRRHFFVWAALLVLLIAVGVEAFFLARRGKPAAPDMAAVLHANNRGVGLIEQFKYQDAAAAFERVIQLAPDWIPGYVNRGIALLNMQAPDDLARARELFNHVLQQDPDNPYGHFCLGIILNYQAKPEEFDACTAHFEAVTRIDPTDPNAWYWLGQSIHDDPDRQLVCYERALQLDPYLRGPIYGLAMLYRSHDMKKAEAFFAKQAALEQANWFNLSGLKYSEMGRYANVIGRVPQAAAALRTGPVPLFQPDDKVQVRLAANARWASAADLKNSPQGETRARIRGRFGAAMAVFDYNRDGWPDLLLLGAVVENGRVRDLLLRNDGAGSWTDVTAEAGLEGVRPSVGCCVADFDNDGLLDVFITGVGEQHLFRNTRSGRFEDVTAKAGLDQTTPTVGLGAAFADLDQDGDLDLIVAQYDSLAEAAKAFHAADTPAGAGLAVYLNTGEAPAAGHPPHVDPPALKPSFRKVEGLPGLLGTNQPVVNATVTDLDRDHDLDLLVLADRTAPTAVLNDRLLHFHRRELPKTLLPEGTWNGACVLDANHDGLFDLCAIGPGQRPVLLLGQRKGSMTNLEDMYQPESVNSPPLLQAQVIDVDLDGYTDVVGLCEQRKPVLLHNEGNKLAVAVEALGRDADWPHDLIALTVTDYNGDGYPDLLVWSEEAGLKCYASQGNKNTCLKVELTGHRRVQDGNPLRCNADGIGAVVIAQADEAWAALENTTLGASLAQARQPLVLGLGQKREADVVRLRWPDNTWQAEFNVRPKEIARIEEANRKPTSCPVLFAWNGQRFGFVTDFLGAGSLGESQVGGGCRPPRPEESVKIEAAQLRPRNGQYVLKLAEPMDEVTYLDRLELAVLDHPGDVRVFPDERLATAAPAPTQELLAFRAEIFPVRASDYRGRDMTQTLKKWDRETVDGFAKRSWLGFAEEHWVELDYGDRLAKFGPADRLVLCLAGWTDYAYPESIWAADQAGIAVRPPVLERQQSDSTWRKVAEIGFPAGLPRMMTYEITGKLGGPRCVLRLRTNLEVYWDQIFVAPLLKASDAVRVSPLPVASAELSARGCMQEFSPDGRLPTLYDYDRLASVPVSRLAGSITRYGDVTELLRADDDRFVIFGPGDEVTVRFDAKRLPELPAGWQRSFVLRTRGYCKDCGPFTATGGAVEPLPFRGMSKYPYGPEEHYPADPLHRDYLRRYNTRKN